MSRAREFADLAGSADAGGLTGRNLIINGAMQVSQRGTSETGVTGGGYHNAPDRWRVDGTLGTWTVSQSTDTPEGFSNSYKLECTTAGASPGADTFRVFQQYIEGQNLQHLKYGTSNAKALTLSFWVKSSKTGEHTGYLYQDDDTRLYSWSYSVSTANTWEYKTITIDGDTTGVLDNNNGASLRVTFFLGAGSNRATGSVTNAWAAYAKADEGSSNQVNLADTVGNEWYITGVQLEVGDKATSFEHRSYGAELMLCQRYFFAEPHTDTYHNVCNGFHPTTTLFIGNKDLPVPMRAGPSVSSSGSYQCAGTASLDASNIIIVDSSGANVSNIQIRATVSGATSGNGTVLRNKNDATATFHLDAEL